MNGECLFIRVTTSFVIVGKHEKLNEIVTKEEQFRVAAHAMWQLWQRLGWVSDLRCELLRPPTTGQTPIEIILEVAAEVLLVKPCKFLLSIFLPVFYAAVLANEIVAQIYAEQMEDVCVGPDHRSESRSIDNRLIFGHGAYKDFTYRIDSIYENLITTDSWNANALTTINQNIMNQHTIMRDHLQDRHQLMVNDITEILETVRNEIGHQIAESNAYLAEVCEPTNRALAAVADPSPVEMTIEEVWNIAKEDANEMEEIEAEIEIMSNRMEGVEAKIVVLVAKMEKIKTKMEGIESILPKLQKAMRRKLVSRVG